jgi:hypothetical protein
LTLLGGSFVFLDVGPSILFLVFSLFLGFINNIQYWMSDSQSASPEENMNSPHLVPRYRIQPTTVAINHNALLLPQLKGRLNTGILHITYMHSIHTNFFHSEYVCMECRPIYILQHLRASPYFKGDTTQPKIQFIMALMIFSARSQVDPLPCLECSPACELPHSCRESKDDQILIISNPYCKCPFNWFILYTHVWGKTGNIKTFSFYYFSLSFEGSPPAEDP